MKIDRCEAKTLLADLVAIDSTNPVLVPGGAGEQEVAEYILDYLRSQDICGRLDRVAEGRCNVIGVLPAAKGEAGDPFARSAGIMLNGHLDTVSAGGMGEEPLRARFEGDRVHGRGSLDMKGGLVMGLLALAAVKRSGRPLHRPVLFTGVVDEEYGSRGTEDVVRRYPADAAIVMEPTDLSVCLAHKGFAWATVEVFGRAAHGSNFAEGIDAISMTGRLLTRLENLNSQCLAGPSHPLVGPASLHASLIEGGKELSTYPDYCRLQMERRTLPDEDPADFARELRDLCCELAAEDADFCAEISLDFTRSGYEVDAAESVVRALEESFGEIKGEEPEYSGSSGWLDSALLGEAGIPTVIFGPGGGGAHAAVEYVHLSTVLQGAEILTEAILRLCGG